MRDREKLLGGSHGVSVLRLRPFSIQGRAHGEASGELGGDPVADRPMHGDLDEEIDGLHRKIRQLKGVAQEIESEAKYQNDFLAQLQMTLIKAQAGVKNNMRRLNKSIIQQGSNHVAYVILFALMCFFVVYLLSKFSRR
uniref:t-SNARE coiled-coil homology domain-containing protein n=1 Tax=Ananas comosus var. bracteatus TaxID=296719 RepID=A0A6V7P627_ANACO|nr:unnamed protein product [Ananas comosus var. bracteatus]